MNLDSTVLDSGCSAREIAAPPTTKRTTLLAIEARRSVPEVAAAMRTAILCSTCRGAFATVSAADRLCDACREHFFEAAPVGLEFAPAEPGLKSVADKAALQAAVDQLFGVRRRR